MVFAVVAVCAAFMLIVALRSIYLVSQAEAIVIERLGRFHRVLKPGLRIIIPFFERPRAVNWTFFKESYIQEGTGRQLLRYTKVLHVIDLRESVYDFPKQNVITKDNVTTEISALLYYQIIDPQDAVYGVNNLPEAIEKLTQTTLRNIIGAMDLDETLVSRDHVNEKLRIILDEAAHKWGVNVNRVELQEVNPPADIRHAMEKQMRAERDRRAAILQAEGEKRAAILQAEGARESNILKAEGEARAKVIAAESEAEARLKIAHAEAQSIELIKHAAQDGDALAYMVATQYVKALPKLTEGKHDKLVIVPYEAAALAGSLASVKELFAKIDAK
jgi:regulator of protease activity HflC (stomatin/prohibitin superfamily)